MDPDCQGFVNPSGKFVDPTWSTDGQMLAWQENDGIWVGAIPADLTNCAGLPNPALRIQGAKTPDFGPAAINPGPRPGCGNPGNPTPCVPGCTTCTPPCSTCTLLGGDLLAKLKDLLARESRALRRLGIRGLLRRRRVRVAYEADRAGLLALRFTGAATAAASRATLLASGRHTFATAGRAQIVLKLTRKGARVLRRARGVRGTLKATFTPAGGTPTTARKTIRLKR